MSWWLWKHEWNAWWPSCNTITTSVLCLSYRCASFTFSTCRFSKSEDFCSNVNGLFMTLDILKACYRLMVSKKFSQCEYMRFWKNSPHQFSHPKTEHCSLLTDQMELLYLQPWPLWREWKVLILYISNHSLSVSCGAPLIFNLPKHCHYCDKNSRPLIFLDDL